MRVRTEFAREDRVGITAKVYAEPVTGCVAVLVTRKVRAAGKLEDAHAEPSDAAGIAWRWTNVDTPVEPLLRCPLEVLDAIVDARLAQRARFEHRIPIRLYRFRGADGLVGRHGTCGPDIDFEPAREIEDRQRPAGAPHTVEVCETERRTVVLVPEDVWRPWRPEPVVEVHEGTDEAWTDPLDLFTDAQESDAA